MLGILFSVAAVDYELACKGVAVPWVALHKSLPYGLFAARHPRLQVEAPVSTVQMEYLSRKKPDAMLASIESTVRACAEKTGDVEFIAEDATRSDMAFLKKAVETAISAGATTVTVCDATGALLPEEFAAFIRELLEN
ncbi:MAG: hypothetical protein IJJ48_07940, partial [Firmicutes bacterium]|nr:hypothetical protein [Bacillota bacterium]